MKIRFTFLTLGLVAAGLFAGSASAQESRITIESTKSYEQTVEKLKGSVSQGGMTGRRPPTFDPARRSAEESPPFWDVGTVQLGLLCRKY